MTEQKAVWQAIIRGSGLARDSIFDRSGPLNRDDCLEPYIVLRDTLRRQGLELHTPDCAGPGKAVFELHMNVLPAVAGPAYLLLLESPLILPANGSEAALARYRRVFTWDDSRADGERFIKINLPNLLPAQGVVDGGAGRDRFCCIIAGNKAVAQYDTRELYSERVRVIRWYEKHAPQDFDLYGTDWDLPPPMPGLLGKVYKRLWRLLSRVFRVHPFPSWRGKVERKQDVLRRTRFGYCYENARDLPGYITEKIFDAFFAGCVPVYWGAGNIGDYIPADCFIDRRQFADTAAVHAHLKAMTEAEYRGYQERIAAFLASPAASLFDVEHFARTVANTLVQDLGRTP